MRVNLAAAHRAVALVGWDDLGNKLQLLLRHHGLLTVGKTVAEAFVHSHILDGS